MNTKIYSVFDLKLNQYQPVFSFNTDVEAQRHFYRLLVSVPTMSEFPQDYDLRHLGTFDDDTGVVTPAITCELITNGLALLESIKQTETRHGEEQKPQERNDASVQQSTESTDTTE